MILSLALSPFGWIYGKIADLRNTLYDRGAFEMYDLGARTISVGNITTGGTGKTPLVAYVASILAEREEKVCVLTRGYGRDEPGRRILVSDGERILVEPKQAGDEPFELAQKLLLKSIVVADRDRVSAAEWAKRKFGITAFVLDDGFQHRRARRDVDIVCIDATNPFGGGKMLPTGRLREPLHNLSRADIIVITRSNLVENPENLKSEISNLKFEGEIFVSENSIVDVVGLQEFHAKPPSCPSPRVSKGETCDLAVSPLLTRALGHSRQRTPGGNAFAFCGLGNPENFYSHLRLDGFTILANKGFRDHHFYSQSDISEIEREAADSGAEILLTTAKDAVKLSNLKFEIPCYVVEIETTLDDPERFAAMI